MQWLEECEITYTQTAKPWNWKAMMADIRSDNRFYLDTYDDGEKKPAGWCVRCLLVRSNSFAGSIFASCFPLFGAKPVLCLFSTGGERKFEREIYQRIVDAGRAQGEGRGGGSWKYTSISGSAKAAPTSGALTPREARRFLSIPPRGVM